MTGPNSADSDAGLLARVRHAANNQMAGRSVGSYLSPRDVLTLADEVAKLREALRLGIELDNHHNADWCPYCTRDTTPAAQAEVANAFVQWAMKNEIAEPPLDWAWFGEIARRYSPLHEEHEPRVTPPAETSES